MVRYLSLIFSMERREELNTKILTLPGTEPGTVILRCSFCVEKFFLEERDSAREKTEPDLEVGETVTVTRDCGKASLAVVVEILSEKYLAVAFDDGTFSDNLDPEDVTPVETELSLNCPVRVRFEGDLYTGVYKGDSSLYWYKVRTIDNMDIIEVEREKIAKRKPS